MTTCTECGQQVPAEQQGLHGNACTRWQCVVCGARFALMPDPLSKRFGATPLCYACKAKQGPAGVGESLARVTPEQSAPGE